MVYASQTPSNKSFSCELFIKLFFGFNQIVLKNRGHCYKQGYWESFLIISRKTKMAEYFFSQWGLRQLMLARPTDNDSMEFRTLPQITHIHVQPTYSVSTVTKFSKKDEFWYRQNMTDPIMSIVCQLGRIS